MNELNNMAGICPKCKLDCFVYLQRHNPDLLLCAGCYKLSNKTDFKELRTLKKK